MITTKHVLLFKESLLLLERKIETEKIETQNNALFISCVSNINGVLIENAEYLDVAMSLCDLPKYSKNYSKISGYLRNYYRDELIDEEPDTNGLNKNVINAKSFKYKTSITGSTYNVAEKITNADGNETDNAAYDTNEQIIS